MYCSSVFDCSEFLLSTKRSACILVESFNKVSNNGQIKPPFACVVLLLNHVRQGNLTPERGIKCRNRSTKSTFMSDIMAKTMVTGLNVCRKGHTLVGNQISRLSQTPSNKSSAWTSITPQANIHDDVVPGPMRWSTSPLFTARGSPFEHTSVWPLLTTHTTRIYVTLVYGDLLLTFYWIPLMDLIAPQRCARIL